MEKILKPYTIIPPELYIQRDADRQIKNIIQDMGRPGYVLVSRQMGKTNLLINAKRRLETPNDIFVYIDLSNPFDSAKSCFENIIDTAIETNFERFESIKKIIDQRRTNLRDTPPHKQHTTELRLLLNSIKGKLIIILDEIDALTKTQYSDLIFAQIRSIYFSRVNYKELEKLTYILSGVIEPNDIIKDPKISPFNIGQKIFLNDFTNEEFNQFVKNSKINVTEEIQKRIFFWTSGNPRMSWDVCSEVENKSQHKKLTPDDVDKIIKEIYLTTYDRPPIDNIRELAKNDREIRNSLIEIEYQKGHQISDKIKNKLYLAGIINYDENDIHIKNEIIKQSLNVEWIRSLEELDKGILKVALEFFEKEKYLESLSTFEKYLKDNVFEEEIAATYFYYMGNAAYKISDFERASSYLTYAIFDIEDNPKLYYRVLLLKALVFYYRELFDESLICLGEIINRGKKDEVYARALLNFGSVSLTSNNSNHKNLAIGILQQIIDETAFKEEDLKISLVNELKSIAYYNLALIQSDNKEFTIAKQNFTNALSLGKANIKPSIILALLKITTNASENYHLLDELIDLLIKEKLRPTDNDPDKPIDFSFDELKNVIINAFVNYKDTLFQKVLPLLNLLGQKSLTRHFYDLAIFSLSNKNWDSSKKLLDEAYRGLNNNNEDISEEIKYNTLKFNSYFSLPEESIKKHIEYLNLFKVKQLQIVDFIDLDIFTNVINELIKIKKYDEALKYIELINSVKSSVPQNILIDYLVIYNFELNIYILTGHKEKGLQKANEIIKLANDGTIRRSSTLLGETGADIIRRNADSFINNYYKTQKPLKSDKSYGRNQILKVRYKDGTIIETKFKKIEKDLKTGECFVLSYKNDFYSH